MQRDTNMEKIVVLTRNNGDENLVNCLKMLFPECVVEVHEGCLRERTESIAPSFSDNDILEERLN
jgi:hypothetical protein